MESKKGLHMLRARLIFFALLLLAAAPFASAPSARADEYPAVLNLPDGWLPEGIAVGHNLTLYAGSRRHGGIFAVNLETGEGRILVQGTEGRVATGLKFDPRSGYIFAAGAATGDLHVYDSETGATVASFKLAATPGPTFINDVIITPGAAYVTDSMRPVLYRLPLNDEGNLPAQSEVEILGLKGDYAHQAGFNVNGIEASPAGDRLIIVQSSTGRLFEVDPSSGHATRIDAPDASAGDGLLLAGSTLYVVRNNLNQVLKLEMTPDFRAGSLAGRLTHPGFDTPTTAALAGDKIYVVNGRFTAGMAPGVTYTVVTLDHIETGLD
jgi:outer membrane protein assembly factor BamB